MKKCGNLVHCRSRRELSNEYLLFTRKTRHRYSRERASQSFPEISQKLEQKLEQTEVDTITERRPPAVLVGPREIVISRVGMVDIENTSKRIKQALKDQQRVRKAFQQVVLRTPVNNIEYFPPNFEGLVLGCIDADFCK